MNPQLQNQPLLQTVNVNFLSEKFKSKKELYQFLTQDGGAFLPRIQSTNIYFFKQIIRGIKNVCRNLDQVKVSAIPHIEGLTVEDFIEYARQKINLLQYLPDERDWVHMDRQWICDVIYTLDTEGINNMVKEAMQQRKDKLEQNRNLLVEMRPEFVEALNKCLNFSHERGRASNLLKTSSKRKRIRSEIEEVKEEETELMKNKQEFLQQVKRLKQEKQLLQEEIIQLSQANQEYAEVYGHENQQQQEISKIKNLMKKQQMIY